MTDPTPRPERTFTPVEMREWADQFQPAPLVSASISSRDCLNTAAMLRQGADAVERESEVISQLGDGVSRLVEALHHRKPKAADYLGGSDARMLHEAAAALTASADREAALREENERLVEVCNDSNAVCLCGCPNEAHENYGEDGEACEHDDHQCLRTSRVAASTLADAQTALTASRAEVARLTGELAEAKRSWQCQVKAMRQVQATDAESQRRQLFKTSAALTAQRQQVNGWREVGEEMQRIVDAMTWHQKRDLLPDWFASRLTHMLGLLPAAPVGESKP